jgi:hypothetical protein
MNESTDITGAPPVAPAARSGLTDLKNVFGHVDGKDGDSPAIDYGYGDDSDSDSEDDSPGGAYGYGGPGGVYGYGGNATPGGACDYGYDNQGGAGDDDKGCDYGYGEDKDTGSNSAGDYGYGDDDVPTKPIPSDALKPARPRIVRRNSCVIHKEDSPLAVAEYLLGGPARMSDRDMDLLELNSEGAISA